VYFTEFQLYNYKSFADSGVLTLKPGFNILTGQNNAGKTALLEGMGLRFPGRPHRSPLPLAPQPSRGLASSWARLRFRINRSEIEEFFQSRDSFYIPQAEASEARPEDLMRLVLDQLHLEVEARWDGQRASPARMPSFGIYRAGRGFLRIEREGLLPSVGPAHGEVPPEQELGLLLVPMFAGRIYSFRAERLNLGRSRFGSARHLLPDASNLPEVVNVLQGSPARFERFNQLVRRVFPSLLRVSARPCGETEVELMLWSEEAGLEREDLAIPLSESGTGIGQVLAILYVLATAETPRVFLIDEPNSFLHPGAAHTLIEILREHSQHQYIVSTHSPEIISASSPATVHVLRKKGSTRVEPINSNATRHLRATLLEVGTRLSDVFGADGVLWVEGKTVEQCLPLIIHKLLKRSLGRTAIIGVRHGTELDGEDSEGALRLYERLSQGAALLPPPVGFLFDREVRSDRAREELVRESKGKVSFFPRRAYENYLLHPGAVAAVLNALRPFLLRPTSAEKVHAWMYAHASDERYYRKSSGHDFLNDINASRFLSDLFSDLSLGEFEYITIEHSVAITDWLIEHEPQALQEVVQLLEAMLPKEAGKDAGAKG